MNFLVATQLLLAVVTRPEIVLLERCPAEAGVGWTAYEVTNFVWGGWTNATYQVTLRWSAVAGRSYVIESSATAGSRPLFQNGQMNGWEGERWTLYSLPLATTNAVMARTFGIPSDGQRFFRVREL